MGGSPKTVRFAVALGDDEEDIALKARAALALDADVVAFFTVGGAGADIVLTALTAAADDPTMNIASDNAAACGVVAVAASADTTPGVAPVLQVETATVVGDVTLSGNVQVVVTAAGMGSSPKTLAVTVSEVGSVPGAVDVEVAGTGQVAPVANTAYVIPATTIETDGYQYVEFDLLFSRTGDAVAPLLWVTPWYKNSRNSGWYADSPIIPSFGGLSGEYGALKRRLRCECRGSAEMALLVERIAGTGASLDVDWSAS